VYGDAVKPTVPDTNVRRLEALISQELI